MKEPSFEKKLASYVALASSILAASAGKADAQIMYTDVIPNDTISNSYFNLDLNNDGVSDFKLSASHNFEQFEDCSNCSGSTNSNNHDEIIMLGQNKIVENFQFGDIQPLDTGEVINQSSPLGNANLLHSLNMVNGWSCSSSGGNTFTFASGVLWFNNEKYLGLKIESGGQNYYGWARLELIADGELILKDYAVNTIPDSSIAAGDVGNGCSINNVTSTPNGHYWYCDTAQIQLHNTNNFNIQWTRNGSWLLGSVDSIYNAHQSGTYMALVSDSSCSILVNTIHEDSVKMTVENICQYDDLCGSSVHITMMGNSPEYTFAWSNGMVTTSYYNQNWFNNVPAGNYQLIISSSICNYSDSLLFVLNVSGLEITETHVDTVCGLNGSIDVSVIGGTSPYAYHWSNGATTQDLNNLGTGQYHLIVTDDNGCSNSITVPVVSSSSFPTVILTQNSNTIYCNPNGAYNYAWYDSSGNLLANTSVNYFTPVYSGNYNVVMSDSICSGTSSIFFNACYISPVIFPTENFIGCDVDSIVISSLLYANSNYFWYHNSDLISSAGNSITVDSIGNYWLVLQYDSGYCQSASNQVSIANVTYPISSVTQVGQQLFANPGYQYQWYLSGNTIPGATNQNYFPVVSGYYSVEETNQFGCITMSDSVYFEIVFVSPIENENGIQLLVDPKYLQIIFPNEKFIGSQMRLFNSTGQLVSEMRATKNTELIPIEQLPKGIYILSIRNGDEIRNYKIAIVN